MSGRSAFAAGRPGARSRHGTTASKGADVLGLATASWAALILGVVVALVIAFVVTRDE